MRIFALPLVLLAVLLTGCGDQKTAQQYIDSGLSHIEKKEWKSAIIEFKNAVKLNPENAHQS